jgi:HEAT repeat protein
MLTRTAAQQPDGPVPILVRLRDYATYRVTASGSLRDFALDQAAHGDAVLRAALEQAPQLLWLVDALDEARGWQGAVVEQVRQLQGDLVLTSRPVGYPGGLESLTHFEVLPLVPDDVDRFLHDWFGVLAAQRKAPDGWVDERVAWLKKQLDERPRIQALTRNPLLLTFLVVLAGDDPVRDLPTQRAELYRRYVEELLDSWEAQRRPVGGADGQPAFKLGRLTGEDARQAALRGLYRTGWYLHLAYNDAMPGYEPTAAGIIAYLGPFLQTEWGCTSGEARSIAQTILSFWVEAGLLDTWRVEKAEYLAFRHLTFQEYAAAWGLRKAYRQNTKQAWRFVRPRLHHYAWREPLLLLSTMLEQKHVDTLIRRLVRGTSRYEHDLLRDLRLATAMMEEVAVLSPKTEQVWWYRVDRIIHETDQYLWLPHSVIALLLAMTIEYTVPGLLLWFFVIILYGRAYSFVDEYHCRRPLRLWYHTRRTRYNIATKFPAVGNPMLPTLETALRYPETKVREAAAEALGRIGVAALPALQAALHDPTRWVRGPAAEALGRIGVAALPALQAALRTPEEGTSSSIAQALGRIGVAALPALQAALHHPDTEVRREATRALMQINTPAVLPTLEAALHDPDGSVRAVAITALTRMGALALPTLEAALHDPHADARWAATRALGQMDVSALPALQVALRDPSMTVRRAAAEALGQMGTPALLALEAAFHDPHEKVRRAAAEALGQMGTPALPTLQVALSSPESKGNWAAAEALGQMGTPALPTLQVALRDPNASVRWAAAEALGQMGTPALPTLQVALRDPNASVRIAAAKALGRMGDPAALPELETALRNPKEVASSHQDVAKALAQIGTTALPILQAVLRDPNASVHTAAAKALGQLGNPAALPALQAALRDPNASVRIAAAKALGQLGNPAALPALQAALHDSDKNMHVWVPRELGNLVIGSFDIKQVRKTARALWWAASDEAIEALEKAANRLSVLEVQVNPGSDPLQRKEG